MFQREVQKVQLAKPSAEDIATVKQQLGREPRGMAAVAVRNAQGEPVVVMTSPRIPEPFPTTYYLTHPAVVSAVSKLEATGWMHELSALVNPESPTYDADLAARYLQAHQDFIADRDALAQALGVTPLTETHSNISAGGMPTRVKCLHALVGHALAKGPGVNPIGDLAIQRLQVAVCRPVCA
jgi:hypothetical protein